MEGFEEEKKMNMVLKKIWMIKIKDGKRMIEIWLWVKEGKEGRWLMRFCREEYVMFRW